MSPSAFVVVRRSLVDGGWVAPRQLGGFRASMTLDTYSHVFVDEPAERLASSRVVFRSRPG